MIVDALRWLNGHEGLGVWVGAIASALVAFVAVGVVFLQRHFDRLAKAEIALERKRSLAFSSLMKLRSIHSTLTLLSRHVDKMFIQGEKLGLKEPWQFMTPMGSVPDKIKFSSDELEAIFSLKDFQLFDEIVLMEQFHNSALLLQETFSRRRIEMTDLLPAEMRGEIGRLNLSQEQLGMIGPRSVELNALVGAMKQHWGPDAESALKMLMRLNELVEAEINLNIKLKLMVPDQAEPVS